ncbi:unnamed protein product [Parnassius apollo]|uniref:(apollo) hypothetical protein n=1 Tax=Parnassius apollo TaxID=110799 RepID=A0A8S3WIF5_PARAO|nr:unnamed protein product [Parnassius apollo]
MGKTFFYIAKTRNKTTSSWIYNSTSEIKYLIRVISYVRENLSKEFSASMIFIVCIFIIYGLYVLKGYSRSKHEPPPLSNGLPIIGHAHQLFGGGLRLWETVKTKSHECCKAGDVTTLSLGPIKCYVLTDAGDFMTVANTCLEKGILYDFAKPWLGEGLLTAPLAKWKTHRKLLNTAFNQQVLDGFLDVFNIQSRRLLEQFAVEEGKGHFDPENYIMRNSLETIFLTATGIDLRADKTLNENYVTLTDRVLRSVVYRFQNIWLYKDFIWNMSSTKKQQDKDIEFLHDVANMIIKQRKKTYLPTTTKATGNNLKSFSDMLFDLEGSNGESVFSYQDVKDHVNTLIVAGYDTVATNLVITLILIGSYKEVQDKIYKELEEVFEQSDRDVEKRDLQRLTYLEAVIKESLRLYPTAPVISRLIDKDFKLKNYTLYSGNNCLLSIYGANRHPVWGEDANDFKPERWLNPETLPKNSNYFLSFSLGRRNCLGKAYAMMWLKTIISHVLRKYLVTGDHNNILFRFDFVLKPHSGRYIAIEKRK